MEEEEKNLWFRRKIYGWGWYPCSWQGWITLLVYFAIIVLDFLRLDMNSHSASDTIRPWIIDIIILGIILLFVCYKKGEKPKWSWGRK